MAEHDVPSSRPSFRSTSTGGEEGVLVVASRRGRRICRAGIWGWDIARGELKGMVGQRRKWEEAAAAVQAV
uniref:Uncharacterized protein n=1 Tax=Arundo donax TaxID=35708 RepID=A0A0A9SPI3_ARUDO